MTSFTTIDKIQLITSTEQPTLPPTDPPTDQTTDPKDVQPQDPPTPRRISTETPTPPVPQTGKQVQMKSMAKPPPAHLAEALPYLNKNTPVKAPPKPPTPQQPGQPSTPNVPKLNLPPNTDSPALSNASVNQAELDKLAKTLRDEMQAATAKTDAKLDRLLNMLEKSASSSDK